MISFDDINSWIRAFGLYRGLIIILTLFGVAILYFAYPEEFYNLVRTNIVKIISILIFFCILIVIFWVVNNTNLIGSDEAKLIIKIISIIVLICFLVGINLYIDNNIKNLGNKSVRVVISPFQKISESSGGKNVYDIGTTEFVKKEIEKNPNIDVKILETNEVITDFEKAKTIADKYNADIVIFGKSINALDESKSLETSIFFSEKIKKAYFIRSTTGFQDSMNGLYDFTIHDNRDISNFKGQIKDIVNLIFGLEKYFSYDYKDSLDFFNNVSETSLNSEIYVYKGYSQLNLNLFDASLESYDKALVLNSRNEFAWNDKGYLYQKMGKYNESLYFFDKSISINPEYPLAWINKGNSLLKLGNYNDALKCYSKPLEKYPDYYFSFNNIGQLEILRGNLTEAEKNLDRATNLNPDSELAWINKGALYGKKGDLNSSLDAIDKALSINPNYPQVWVTRGQLLEKLTRNDDALKSFDRAISIDPDFSSAYYRKGILYYNLAKYDDAINCFKKSVELNPSYYDAQIHLGMSYGQKKDYAMAEQAFIKAIEIDPEQTIAQKNLIYLFDISGKESGYEIRVQLKNNTIIIVSKS